MMIGPSSWGLGEGEFRKVYELAHSATLLHLKWNGIKNKHGIFISFTTFRIVR